MSGYLEVKYPSKSNLGLNPFKSWKRQWCILRPSGTWAGGSLAVYCSEAGACAGAVALAAGGAVRRAASRSRPFAFAVFAPGEHKPQVLLAASTLHEAHTWMDKIKLILNGDSLFGSESLLKDSYFVMVLPTELSNRCGASGDCTLTTSPTGLLMKRAHKLTFIHWKHIIDISMCSEDRNGCIFTVDSEWEGGGSIRVSTPLVRELFAGAVRLHAPPAPTAGAPAPAAPLRTPHSPAISKSDSDIPATVRRENVRRTSWNNGPPDVSLDDIHLVISKDGAGPWSPLSRCGAACDLTPELHRSSDRRSMVSVASGIYEEIPDLPESDEYCSMGPADDVDAVDGSADAGTLEHGAEPTYECVGESLFATLRPARRHPPPLPPRLIAPSWGAVRRTGSLGALPQPPPPAHAHYNKTFSVFRKRLKSDSRIASSSSSSPKSDSSKDGKTDTKKKKFDFAPTRDIFKSFRVGRKKNAKNVNLDAAKSCEFLDDTDRGQVNRCSKSEECLELSADLSLEQSDSALAALSLPEHIVRVLLRARMACDSDVVPVVPQEVCVVPPEGHYMPMSPVVPQPPPDHHYIVMSPRAPVA